VQEREAWHHRIIAMIFKMKSRRLAQTFPVQVV